MDTIEDIKVAAEAILDQTIDDDLFLIIINAMKDRREEMRPWQFLLKLDSSQSATSSAINLPTDFKLPRKMRVGSGYAKYSQVKFDEQHLYVNTSNRYFLDMANGTYKLLGNIGSGGTIYFYYLKTTPYLTDLSDELVWPVRFWPLLAFEIAGYIMNGQDADDIFARMSPENKSQAILLGDMMESWDNQLQIAAQDGLVGMGEAEAGIELGNM